MKKKKADYARQNDRFVTAAASARDSTLWDIATLYFKNNYATIIVSLSYRKTSAVIQCTHSIWP